MTHSAQRLRALLQMIRFSHTLFAMPFALLSLAWAAGGWPGWRVFGLVLLAMVSARSSAMTFNRIADRRFDRENPRTASWPLVSGAVSMTFAWAFLAAMVFLFIFSAWALNFLAFALSPIALLVLLGYSLTKRFTSLCHLFLGLALGIAPAGAWVAVRGEVGAPSIWLGCAVLAWVAGFDVLYALQDLEFDRRAGLHSIPARFGVAASLWISGALHAATAALMVLGGLSAKAGLPYFAGVAAAAILLTWEHAILRPSDLSRLNAAFFTLNGWMSVLLFAFGIADLFL